MAKSRNAESTRERAPSRGRGMSLVAAGMLSAVAASLCALFGAVFAAGNSSGALLQQVDDLGVSLTGLLTAPEPGWWAEDHDTFEAMVKRVRDRYPDEVRANWPQLPKDASDKVAVDTFNLKQRNLKRLQNAMERAGAMAGGALRGLELRFTGSGLRNQQAGAGVSTVIGNPRRVGSSDVVVGPAQAVTTSGNFAARVYQREYKTADGRKVGDAYAIFSQEALDGAGGAGMWLILAPLLTALAAMGFLLAASKATKGLRGVVRDLEAVGRGKLGLRVTTGAGGEVGMVQRALDKTVKNLQLIQTTGSGDLDEAVEKELSMAAQIHQSLRPADPPRVAGYEVETLFKPGLDIGSDYFDYVDLDDGRLALLIADCSENLRGVPAAMVMAMTRAYLKSIIDPATTPADWLKAVNRRLSRDLRQGMAVTALVLVLDKASGDVLFASAGHRPLVLWRQGKTATINPNGIALGLDIGPVFDKTIEEKKVNLQPNDRLVVYTDGVVSAANAEGVPFGEAAFVESVRKQGGMNSAAFVNFVAGSVDRHLAGAEQSDDITISTIKRMK